MRGIITAGVVLISLASSQQTFRVSVDAVRVDVLVTDGNRPVGGLTATDFELRDSGVLQHLESVSFEDVPLSVMLALDVSSSVRGQPLDNLKGAGSAVAGLLRPGDRAALLTFSEEIDLSSDWSADHQPLAQAIERTRASGSTALHDAAYAALTLKDPQSGRLLVLLFSDGDDTESWLSGRTVIDFARRSDAVVYSVGLRHAPVRKLGYLVDFRSGPQPDVPRVVPSELTRSFLTALAEETGGKYIDAERSDRLRETFAQIVTEFRSRYLLTYIPAGVEAGGWHPIDVKLKNKKGNITARRGYLR
jgi:VWFA-related protein